MEREVITQKVQIKWTEVSNRDSGRLSVAESEEVPCLRQLSLPSPVDPCARAAVSKGLTQPRP